ncbi:DUF2808 domain-containing protein [Leptolyngbya sp. FACHB-321]|uniref:DUF2808 domain-containing protein n=1 Tax=Leptolyngbya sp. FACHB-321 TaxID=2692807 RepID=UPI001681E320|nr:DUF2808 domain-containing protein [Leptolyngbya sp. FACHB-321]MBD2033511.1 DUF2808 domain-containing protein [Leptolyngbya sp. FACHB-321]
MQFQKFTIGIALATLAVATQQHETTASPALASHVSTKYDVTLQQLGLQTNQLQTTQSQSTPSQTPQSQTTQFRSQKSIGIGQAGQSFFSHPPQLVRAAALPNGGSVSSTYEFTLTVPQDAGQPLKAVTIAQAPSAETVKFNVTNNRASIGRRFAAGPEIRLASVRGDQSTNLGEATVVFNQPVLPGNTVTLSLPVQKNPHSSGVYLFGVTAYPEGENGLGQFLGYGRINFYGNSN